jgi:SAM-dependent methyltransferase
MKGEFLMLSHKDYKIQFPELDSVEQGKEHFFLESKGRKEKITFHDYDRLYEIPGLYETLFYDRYQCNSPEVVCGLLKKQIDREPEAEAPLLALDVGAGNGMVGELLAEDLGAETIVGIDIIEEAAEAARRDRPNVYDAYHVADLTALDPVLERSLEQTGFNCMTVVAALGFDDIPPEAFASGYNLVSSPGWVAFNIKEDFVCERDESGFCRLIGSMEDEGILDVRERRRYRHRLCQDGTPLYYHAIVGEKRGDIPEALVVEASA